MAPSRPYDGCHRAGGGPPSQRPAGGGVERGRRPPEARRPAGTEATSPGDAAGSPAGARAAGKGSHGRLRGFPGASPLNIVVGGHCSLYSGRQHGAFPPQGRVEAAEREEEYGGRGGGEVDGAGEGDDRVVSPTPEQEEEEEEEEAPSFLFAFLFGPRSLLTAAVARSLCLSSG